METSSSTRKHAWGGATCIAGRNCLASGEPESRDAIAWSFLFDIVHHRDFRKYLPCRPGFVSPESGEQFLLVHRLAPGKGGQDGVARPPEQDRAGGKVNLVREDGLEPGTGNLAGLP
jgi:hypothetical protein